MEPIPTYLGPRSRVQQARHMRTMSGLSFDASLVFPPNSNTTTGRLKLPFLGGFYLSDMIMAAWVVSVNILRTCSIAEVVDMVCLFAWYHLTALLSDMRQRRRAYTHTPSYFYAYTLCVTQLLMHYFPFLAPRVALAPESHGPIIQWRTGGGAATLIRPYHQAPNFRAYWISRRHRRAPEPLATMPRVVVLYVHGGGFALGSVALYTEPLLRILGHMEHMSPSLTVDCVALEYDLMPHAHFPAPLLQVLRCYAHLIEAERIPASHIVLAGDSAGGNLVLSALLCLSGQGTSEVAERNWASLPMPGKAVLISPWVDLRPREAWSTERVRHATKLKPSLDILSAECLVQFAQWYAGVLKRPRRIMGPVTHLCESLYGTSFPLLRWCREWLERPLLRYGKRILPPEEAVSDPIRSTSELFDATSLAHKTPTTPAERRLETSPLLSPTLGDWRAVSLEHGFFVTWGANELMARDIQAWSERVTHATCYVESGGSGVHVWPFFHALLAPTMTERERGLQLLARAMMEGVSTTFVPYSSETDSPTSMPSDIEDMDDEGPRSMQEAWDAELAQIGVKFQSASTFSQNL